MQMEILKQKMRALDMSTACAAGLSGGSAGNLSQELAGIRPMQNAKYLRLNGDLSKLIEIQKAIEPLRLDLKNVTLVREWLDLWTAGNLKISVTSEQSAGAL
jgi:hypothetical protein